jgi:hypothetical protein
MRLKLLYLFAAVPAVAAYIAYVNWPSTREASGDRPAYQVGERIAPAANTAPDAAASAAYREITWEELLPPGWDPLAPFKGLQLDKLQDDDPQAQTALDEARKYWNDAPLKAEMDGTRVRLPGFVVSLGGEGERLQEFLLVPYFGACIHVPPPPVNQVVHVVAKTAHEGIRTMDTVWISGTLRVERAQTLMGDAGYAMRDAEVAPFSPPAAERR